MRKRYSSKGRGQEALVAGVRRVVSAVEQMKRKSGPVWDRYLKAMAQYVAGLYDKRYQPKIKK